MDPLHQGIRNLDPDTFQRLCFHIQKERLPGVELRLVEGESGDEGLDLFYGDLADGPIVFQCKSFRRDIGKSQKAQIRSSLATAVEKFKPRKWILCVSVDLDPKTHRWFQRLQKSYARITEVGLWQASEIAHELLHRKEIREHFLPNIELNVSELRKLVARTGELSHEELEALTEQNLSDFVDRLKARDARFDYEIIFGPHSTSPVQQQPRPGLMASIRTGKRTLNIFARDHEALRLNPPQMQFTFSPTARQKFESLQRSGRAQEFSPDEILDFKTDLPMFEKFRPTSNFKLLLHISKQQLTKHLKCQVVFGHGADRVEYKLVEFKPIRIGTDEIELQSVSECLSFDLNVVLPFNPESEAAFSLSEKFDNRDIKDVAKFFNALYVLRKCGTLTFHELEQDVQLFSAEVKLQSEKYYEPWLRELANDLASVSEFFKVRLSFPAKEPPESDLQSLLLLRNAASGFLQLDNIRAELIKSEENQRTTPELLPGGSGAFRFEVPFLSPKPVLFGTEIDTGPCAVTIENGVLENLQQFREEFEAANLNEAVHLSIKPLGPVRFELLR